VGLALLEVLEVVTLETERGGSVREQSRMLRGMGVVALRTFIDHRVFEGRFFKEVVMALEAHGFAGFEDQTFMVGDMRGVAAKTFTRFGGGMFNFGLLKEIVVAIETEGCACFCEQSLIGGCVRRMAGGTFA